MADEKNLTELVDSYKLLCMGVTNTVGIHALEKENALNVIVKIYRDGKSEAECTCLNARLLCWAANDEHDYRACPFVTKARGEQTEN